MGRMVRKGPPAMPMHEAIKNLQGMELKVGFFASAKYDDGTPVAYVASIHEFGSSAQNIPPRPFMRPVIQENWNEWITAMRKGARAVIKGRYTVKQIFETIGADAAGKVSEKIASIQSPPLKESTVKARLRKYADSGTVGNLAKPLVDTALMVTSVNYEVTTK